MDRYVLYFGANHIPVRGAVGRALRGFLQFHKKALDFGVLS